MGSNSEKYMPREAIHELEGTEFAEEQGNKVETEFSPEIRDLLKNIDARLATQLFFRNKINEGQQALIFKIESKNIDDSQDIEGQKKVDDYLPETKSVKVLKVISEQMAANEFKWHDKVYGLYQGLSEEEKGDYAGIPKPLLTHTLTITESLKEKLNRQNAELSADQASIILMDWVEGEDLLTKLFRLYLSDRPAYKDSESYKNMSFSSLLLTVSNDFRSRGLDFDAMDTLEQYKRLLQAVTKNGHQLLTDKQKSQIRKTIRLMHGNQIYHNDLHLRNFVVEDGPDGDVYIIDFGRSDSKPEPYGEGIDDEFVVNLLSQYRLESDINQEMDRNISADIQRLLSRDKSTTALVDSFKRISETDLMRFLNVDSGQWRLDSWQVKRVAAAAFAILKTDPNRARLVCEFLKTKKSSLQVESAQVVDWLDRQN